jgi:hypothetical protein
VNLKKIFRDVTDEKCSQTLYVGRRNQKKRKQNFKCGDQNVNVNDGGGDLMKKKNKLLPNEFLPCEFGLGRKVNLQIANFRYLVRWD